MHLVVLKFNLETTLSDSGNSRWQHPAGPTHLTSALSLLSQSLLCFECVLIRPLHVTSSRIREHYGLITKKGLC